MYNKDNALVYSKNTIMLLFLKSHIVMFLLKYYQKYPFYQNFAKITQLLYKGL